MSPATQRIQEIGSVIYDVGVQVIRATQFPTETARVQACQKVGEGMNLLQGVEQLPGYGDVASELAGDGDILRGVSDALVCDGKTGYIQNKLSGKCIDVGGQPGTANGTPLWLFGCEWSGYSQTGQPTDMLWSLDGKGFLKNNLSGRCLDVPPELGPWANLAQLQIRDCEYSGFTSNGQPTSQQWLLDERGYLRNQRSGKCVEVAGQPGVSDGAKIQLYDCEESEFSSNGSKTDQQWLFTGGNRPRASQPTPTATDPRICSSQVDTSDAVNCGPRDATGYQWSCSPRNHWCVLPKT